jgi:hypothetical protein
MPFRTWRQSQPKVKDPKFRGFTVDFAPNPNIPETISTIFGFKSHRAAQRSPFNYIYVRSGATYASPWSRSQRLHDEGPLF